jgi:hypothetical protein
VKGRFRGGVHWFRSGPWDAATLAEMLSIRFGTARARAERWSALRTFFHAIGSTFIVFDNHENDRAMSELLNHLQGAPVTWVLTARRCLLAGIQIFPVMAPQATTGASAFARVRALTNLLRHSPLALDMADAVVQSGAETVDGLRSWLIGRGVDRICVIEHEDDLPEARLLVDWAWARLGPSERRMLAVLAHSRGDHVDGASLSTLARVRSGAESERALAQLRAWHIVQCPLSDRYTLHAVVRHALSKRTRFSQTRFLRHYLSLLERSPERLDLEQTHLYAAMDHAHAESNMGWILRIDRLLAKLA